MKLTLAQMMIDDVWWSRPSEVLIVFKHKCNQLLLSDGVFDIDSITYLSFYPPDEKKQHAFFSSDDI